MGTTSRESIQVLCKTILTRLQNQKVVDYDVTMRQDIENEVVDLVGPHIFTEQDLRDQALESIGLLPDAVNDPDLFQSPQFRTARSMVRKTFGDDELNGFYFQKSLKDIAELIVNYLMDSQKIEEVYDSDDELVKKIVEIVRRFNPSNVH